MFHLHYHVCHYLSQFNSNNCLAYWKHNACFWNLINILFQRYCRSWCWYTQEVVTQKTCWFGSCLHVLLLMEVFCRYSCRSSPHGWPVQFCYCTYYRFEPPMKWSSGYDWMHLFGCMLIFISCWTTWESKGSQECSTSYHFP